MLVTLARGCRATVQESAIPRGPDNPDARESQGQNSDIELNFLEDFKLVRLEEI